MTCIFTDNDIKYDYMINGDITVKFKKILKTIINHIRRIIGDFLKLIEKEPMIIMYMEGGFSSQLLRYAKGQWFAERGMKVKYDLQWFDYNGMDGSGVETREWRIPLCFPDTKLEIASDREIKKYKMFYSSEVHDTARKYKGRENEMTPPLYMAKFDMDYLVSFKDCVKYFDWQGLRNILCDSALEVADEIKMHQKDGKKVIGVHVRRGDMTATGGYWKVLTPKYFEAAIEKAATDACILYFFSNGFEYVKEELLPNVKQDYVLVDGHYKEYEDIYLYSLCDIQIASQGSWGELAYQFNESPERIMIFPNYSIDTDMETYDNGTIKHIHLTDEMYIH